MNWRLQLAGVGILIVASGVGGFVLSRKFAPQAVAATPVACALPHAGPKTRVTKRVTEKRPDGSSTTVVDTTTKVEAPPAPVAAAPVASRPAAPSIAARDWHVSLLAGTDYVRASDGLTRSDFFLGAHVERRVLGPFYLGAWALSSGAAGLSVGVTF